MSLVIFSLLILLAGAGAALMAGRRPGWATRLGAGSAAAGALPGLAGAALALVSPGPAEQVRLAWAVPLGSFFLELDALSAFFLLPILGLTGLAAVYGARYLRSGVLGERLGRAWALYNLLTVSLVLVVLARNAMLFLMAWEAMALASFFLVTLEDERESVRRAGWTYLVATHLGTLALFFFFILMGRAAGSMDFDRWAGAGALVQGQATTLFLLALVGFGAKAGLVPLHVWLPEAHPAAPSHVSAVMSGVMIKTGVYGLMRTLTWLGPPPVAWAGALIAVGIASGVIGVLLAVAQHDLKRLLAYHSVENVGLIVMGLGLGALGHATGMAALTVLGYGGALWHTLNHAAFKGLLFLGAGSVLHGAGSLNLERLGGLMKRLPWTGATFLAGAVAICGLPPFNGFISEFMIYLGAFRGMRPLGEMAAWAQVAMLAVVCALALIGALAAACFAKAFGIAFLGEPRSAQAAQAHEAGGAMRWPMAVLAGLCLLIGLAAPWLVDLVASAVGVIAGLPGSAVQAPLERLQGPLLMITWTALALGLLLAALALWRGLALARRRVASAPTWDCGYAAPTARMQSTASSFAQPLLDLCAPLLRPRREVRRPEGFFPAEGSFVSHTPDVFTATLWRPLFAGAARLLALSRRFESGGVHRPVLAIALTLVILLAWKLG